MEYDRYGRLDSGQTNYHGWIDELLWLDGLLLWDRISMVLVPHQHASASRTKIQRGSQLMADEAYPRYASLSTAAALHGLFSVDVRRVRFSAFSVCLPC